MELTDLKPIQNESALLIESKRLLVIADLHIGIESELRGNGLSVTSQISKMVDRLTKICKEHNPKEIVLLGDVKHNIPSSTISEKKYVTKFLDSIKEFGLIHIIPGNHDGNIQDFISDGIILHQSDGLKIRNIGFVHGHKWPSKDILQTKHIIMAHTHPTIRLTDRLKHMNFEPCWIKAKFLKDKLEEKYPESANPEVLIMPAFNPLCGGIAVNKDGITGPLGKLINIYNSQIYLLDGTYLGKVKNIR